MRAAPVFEQGRLAVDADAVFLFLGVCALYLFCAYPSIAPRDSADLAAAAFSLGVAHPPGYPFYVVLGKAWMILLPWGNPAYRLNALSAFCGALAASIFFIFLRRRTSRAAAWGACLAVSLGSFFWKFCLLEEMYSIHALFLVVLLTLADGDDRSFARRLSLSGLLFGLGLVNHQSLVLLSPALFWLWLEPSRRSGRTLIANVSQFCVFCALGLLLEIFLWLRLSDAMLAWDILRRASYGTLTLFGPYSAPLTSQVAWSLMSCLTLGLLKNGIFALLLALVGAWTIWRSDRRWFGGFALGFLFFGPFYFLATRFNLSLWTARSVLAPDFIAPSLFLCALCAFGLDRLSRAVPIAAWPAAVLLALWPAVTAGSGMMGRRNDFSAYDYSKDLLRGLPAQSTALVAGDSALFGLRYLSLVSPEVDSRNFADATRPDAASWISREIKDGSVYVTGLPESRLAALGLAGNPLFLHPQGLFQKVEFEPLKTDLSSQQNWFWLFSAQRFAPDGPDDDYAHDIRLCYGFAHYLSARLLDPVSPASASVQYRMAFAADWLEYRLAP